MNKNLKVTMWSSSGMDLENLDLVLDDNQGNTTPLVPEYEPTPYTFTKLENGRKIIVEDPASLIPPSWLLLDHTIAVIWSLFGLNSNQLNIDDLKWAHQFLKEIRNDKGENPPDVKACLKEIQDRLINLYARLTSLQEEDFDEIAAAFGEKIIADSTTSYLKASVVTGKDESKFDTTSLSSSSSPSRTSVKLDPPALLHPHSSKDLPLGVAKRSSNSKHKRIAMNYSKKTFPLLDKDSNIFEEPENEDEEVEKYILSLFSDDKKEESLREKSGLKSCIPTKKKSPTTLSFSEMIASQNSTGDITKTEKTSKKVHCVAEMRSLKFQKSMKVQDTNGEEAAYSNLKAEIRRLTINPKVSKDEIMKFLREWRSEQVDRLHNELKRLNSIEEFMKSVGKNGPESNLQMNSSHPLNETSFGDN